MHDIEVVKKDGETYEVTVKDSTITTHIVTLTDEYCQDLTEGQISAEKLIEKSFEFLLERESNTMILSRFDLPVIGEYFPEYEKLIVERL
ncbi:MAG: hypothetical protein LJE88_09600 [Deltaproteobacteria bacterium]|jgi:maltodextrin utilization protein YvdJ|nr:hypothetical protein [Deltaproteobacteria bacterium]